jgi:hypothetical protein
MDIYRAGYYVSCGGQVLEPEAMSRTVTQQAAVWRKTQIKDSALFKIFSDEITVRNGNDADPAIDAAHREQPVIWRKSQTLHFRRGHLPSWLKAIV